MHFIHFYKVKQNKFYIDQSPPVRKYKKLEIYNSGLKYSKQYQL